MTAQTDLLIRQGKTFSRLLRWEAQPIVYKAITAITQTAPVRITAAAHGIPSGWRAAVTSVKGMCDINADEPIRDSAYHKTTVIDVNTIEFNDVNAADFKAYTSGGYVQYNTPVDLTGVTARLMIKDKVGGTTLVTLTTENNGIVIDDTAMTIRLVIAATATALYTWKKGVYDLEMISPDGTVTLLLSGNVAVEKEVTT